MSATRNSSRLFLLVVVVLVLGSQVAGAALVAQYTFDEGSGTTVGDSIGGVDATVLNNPTPGWTSGIVGSGALGFDGSDYAEVSGATLNPLNGKNSFSVSWWMNTTQGDKDAGIISCDGGGNRLMIWRNNGAVYADGYVTDLGTANFLNDGQWHHYTLTKENAVGWRVYRDGIDADSSTQLNTFVQGNNPLRFARHASTGADRRWPGTLDDVGLWDEVLPAEEIALLNGLGRYSNVDAGDSGIDAVLAAFGAGPGSSAVAGGRVWRYASAEMLGTAAAPIGTAESSAAMGPYIVLDSSGNGMLTGPVNIGAGTSIPLEGFDTPGSGARTNLDEGFAQTLDPGLYSAEEFVFQAGQLGEVTPFLAKLTGTHQYEVLALGDNVVVSETGLVTAHFGGDCLFTLDETTLVFAGITNPPGKDNPVYYDSGTATLTDHDGSPTPILLVGQTVDGFSNPDLGRTYAFSIVVQSVPEPATWMLMALGAAVLLLRRKRR